MSFPIVGLFALAFLHSVARGDDASGEFHQRIQPILNKYCFDCHGDGAHKGNVALDQFNSDADLLGDNDLWYRVLKNVRSGLMPPKDKEKPSDAEQAALANWIKFGAFGIDAADVDPGHVTLRRLNRVEYRNTIRDLLGGIDFNTQDEFPPDDTGYGFDTIGDVLSVSPMLLEKYLRAAQLVVGEAVPTVPKRIAQVADIPGSTFKTDKGVALNLSFYEPATARATFAAPHAGQFRLKITLHVHGGFTSDPGTCNFGLKIDDKEAWTERFTWSDTKQFHFDVLRELSEGTHELKFTLEPLTAVAQKDHDVQMDVSSVVAEGPLEEKFWVDTHNYKKFFPRREVPSDAVERKAYARELIEKFARRAFRRPVDEPTLDRLMKVAESIWSQKGKRFEDGISQAMIATLASPRFVFRTEKLAAGSSDLLDEYALATRLSYFMLSTTPDEELLSLADRGELRKNLPAQIRRLLNDGRSNSMIRDFAGQWLQLRDVEGINVDAGWIQAMDGFPPKVAPATRPAHHVPAHLDDLDGQVRFWMRQEPEMLFTEIVREDLPIRNLIAADHTFINEKMADIYGVEGVNGIEMRRVTLPPDSLRGGVLSMSATLLVTSNPTRTSPVKRGQFILDNILGCPAPPPPANIPPLESAESAIHDRTPSHREVLEIHRSKPLCASCHARMDPLGFSLESFNALGMYRDYERGVPIDSAGELITGEKFSDVRELKQILIKNHLTDFYRCLTEKLLTYATGRGLEYYDVETVDRIVDRLQREDGKFSALLTGVIESAPFQRQRPSRDAVKTARNTDREKSQTARDEP